MSKVLVTGALGQIGSELVPVLRSKYGKDSVFATGHVTKPPRQFRNSGPFVYLNVLDREAIAEVIMDHDIDTIYHLSSILSATGERNPQLAYEVNIGGLANVLEVARMYKIERIMIPSSIAVFGQETPRHDTPNNVITRPTTMYGITKVLGELLGEYYYAKYGLDVRSVRLPGIISSETPPGGGTTDYSVEMFYKAVEGVPYTCFVRDDTVLPMMYMPDAIKAMIDLMQADNSKLTSRVYNVTGMSFSAEQLAASIKEIVPGFTCDYKPDYRQAIADSWPTSLDDSLARNDWGWRPDFNLATMTHHMVESLRSRLFQKQV
ncbi:MAG: NAD-dependent epimerase/dehydratase family protein [archaeon]